MKRFKSCKGLKTLSLAHLKQQSQQLQPQQHLQKNSNWTELNRTEKLQNSKAVALGYRSANRSVPPLQLLCQDLLKTKKKPCTNKKELQHHRGRGRHRRRCVCSWKHRAKNYFVSVFSLAVHYNFPQLDDLVFSVLVCKQTHRHTHNHSPLCLFICFYSLFSVLFAQ